MGKKLIKRGIKKLKGHRIVRPFETKESIILRDFLALERTTLANERTLFAYIRTGLYLILGGIGLIELSRSYHLKWLGYLALGISFFLIIYGLIRYRVLKRKLRKYYNSIDHLPEVPKSAESKVHHPPTTGKKQG